MSLSKVFWFIVLFSYQSHFVFSAQAPLSAKNPFLAKNPFSAKSPLLEKPKPTDRAEIIKSIEDRKSLEVSTKRTKSVKKCLSYIPLVLNLSFSLAALLMVHRIWEQPIDPWFALEYLVTFGVLETSWLFMDRCCCSGRRLGKIIGTLGVYGSVTLLTCLWAQTLVLGAPYMWGDSYGVGLRDSSVSLLNQRSLNYSDITTILEVSDPKIFWAGGPETNTKQALSLASIGLDSKAAFASFQGDLTSYFKPYEAQQFLRGYYPVSKVKVPIFLGLGEHDYENNIGNCWGPWWSAFTTKGKWCANYATKIIKDFVKQHPYITDYDPKSLAYAWEVEDRLTFIQLHNSGDYEASSIGISSSFPWLVGVLQKAQKLGKKVIIHQHLPDFASLEVLLNENGIDNVVCAFAGHYDFTIGNFGNMTIGGKEVPIFLSGSAESYSFLILEYHRSTNKFNVSSVDTRSGKKTFVNSF